MGASGLDAYASCKCARRGCGHPRAAHDRGRCRRRGCRCARFSEGRDPCVVATAPLSRMVQEYVDQWNRERPPCRGGRFAPAGARTQDDYVSAVSYLEARTRPLGVERKTIQKVRGAVLPDGRLREGCSRYTELRVADALVAAIGRTDAMSPLTGELAVLPNPRSRLRGQCCGGADSLNGAG